jgi:hypothetical protein
MGVVRGAERADGSPAATRIALARITLGLDAVTEMDWLVSVQRMNAKHLPDSIVEEVPEATAWAMRDLNPRPRACGAGATRSPSLVAAAYALRTSKQPQPGAYYR